MFWKDTSLPLWMVMAIRWKRYCVSNESDVTMVSLLPICCISSVACAFHGPPVSIATGRNKCVPINLSYFAVLLTAALSAATPAVREVFGRCDGAKVSGTVTSHTRGLPFAHGIRVAPAGRFPSSRVRPSGSLIAGICAFLTALQIKSFRCEWRICLGGAFSA